MNISNGSIFHSEKMTIWSLCLRVVAVQSRELGEDVDYTKFLIKHISALPFTKIYAQRIHTSSIRYLRLIIV